MQPKTEFQTNFVKCIDGVYRHESCQEIFNKAKELTDKALYGAYHSLPSEIQVQKFKEWFEMLQNKEHWKNPCSMIFDNKENAINAAAAIMWYHGGVEITANSEGNAWGIYSKGYYHYLS
jgi:hypothetical protein